MAFQSEYQAVFTLSHEKITSEYQQHHTAHLYQSF